MAETMTLPRSLVFDAVRVTETTAIAAADLMGLGDEKAADQAAVDAMRGALNVLRMDGTVVIGEGERDEAPMLFIGEKVGRGEGPKIDIALDPLEGTTITAKGAPNALAVLAFATEGGLLNAPDVYMDKIAVGGSLPEGVVDLDKSPADNLKALAEAKGCSITDLVACILDRPRHAELVTNVRAAGARISLIPVLAAAALQCIGGQIQGRLLFRNDDERGRARRLGITDFDRKYGIDDLASGDVIFSATGVTDGSMLQGVRRTPGGASTHSLVMRSQTRTVRWIIAHHDFMDRPGEAPSED
jgi:fructose-1,6-bisphosphatase II / sedoheptulose-1,7-bisphosphatase